MKNLETENFNQKNNLKKEQINGRQDESQNLTINRHQKKRKPKKNTIQKMMTLLTIEKKLKVRKTKMRQQTTIVKMKISNIKSDQITTMMIKRTRKRRQKIKIMMVLLINVNVK